MRLYRLASYLVIVVLLPLLSCEKTIIEQVSGPNGNGKLYSIEGHAQKGPFIVGTDVTVAELNDKLFPTGRVFFSTIIDDKGRFELPGVVLESPFIQIKVRGRYFSETGGVVFSEELTLYSLADVTKGETINVNILTHLEKERVEYLIQNQEFTFENAKEQAQHEILEIFEWEDIELGKSEALDLSQNSLDGAVLLALSSIFENIEMISRLETITRFKIDFRDDGELNSGSVQSHLLTSASMLNYDIIRANMEGKYKVNMPDFEQMVDKFSENSGYVNYFDLIAPISFQGMKNLLRVKGNTLNPNESYGFIILPKPDSVRAWEVARSVAFLAQFNTTSTYPNNSPNDFTISSSSDFPFSYTIQNQFCSPESQEICYTGFTSGILADIWNGGTWSPDSQTPIIKPVSFKGSGSLIIGFDMDIENIVRWSHKEMTW